MKTEQEKNREIHHSKPHLNLTEQDIIEGCRRDDRKAQKALYDRFSPVMFGVCLRYLKTREDAEDLLVEGLFKAMTKIDQYSGDGSFEGWIRRIVINECLMHLRKKNVLQYSVEIQPNLDHTEEITIEDELMSADLLKLLDQLPAGYRTVFNLYVLEGFKHREIADLLGISINTSKSQLILARRRLEDIVVKMKYPGVENYAQRAGGESD
ncbi:MAG TPA: sigma-70 family RNA polymerase sigma factor [Saprospiraceae bacterium]|nr:sigma-70 family RNA polymerase sigma factor [Saprospiraceae bacterium]